MEKKLPHKQLTDAYLDLTEANDELTEIIKFVKKDHTASLQIEDGFLLAGQRRIKIRDDFSVKMRDETKELTPDVLEDFLTGLRDRRRTLADDLNEGIITRSVETDKLVKTQKKLSKLELDESQLTDVYRKSQTDGLLLRKQQKQLDITMETNELRKLELEQQRLSEKLDDVLTPDETKKQITKELEELKIEIGKKEGNIEPSSFDSKKLDEAMNKI